MEFTLCIHSVRFAYTALEMSSHLQRGDGGRADGTILPCLQRMPSRMKQCRRMLWYAWRVVEGRKNSKTTQERL